MRSCVIIVKMSFKMFTKISILKVGKLYPTWTLLHKIIMFYINVCRDQWFTRDEPIANLSLFTLTYDVIYNANFAWVFITLQCHKGSIHHTNQNTLGYSFHNANAHNYALYEQESRGSSLTQGFSLRYRLISLFLEQVLLGGKDDTRQDAHK